MLDPRMRDPRTLGQPVTITLREESWKNLIHCLHQSRIESQGNFWAAVQEIERQLEEAKVRAEG